MQNAFKQTGFSGILIIFGLSTIVHAMKIPGYIALSLNLVILGCDNYETKIYRDYEDEVLKEITPQLIQLVDLCSMNDFGDGVPTLYLIDHLDTRVELTPGLEEKITLNKSGEQMIGTSVPQFDKEEQRLFKPFLNGSIKDRILTSDMSYQNLVIKKISEQEFKEKHSNRMLESMKSGKNIIGFLSITRIAFNRDYDTGYMSFGFFCGEACGWGSNIEIKNRDGKWLITREFSGWIS